MRFSCFPAGDVTFKAAVVKDGQDIDLRLDDLGKMSDLFVSRLKGQALDPVSCFPVRDVLGGNPQNANLDPTSFQDHVVPAQSRHLGFGIQNIAVNEWSLVVVHIVGHVFLAKVKVMVAQAADVVADRVVSSSKAGQIV